MENIFESLGNLNVSEECFSSIILFVEDTINEAEGIMDLRKKHKRQMLSTWVNAQNDEAATASNKYERARRNLRNALKAYRRGDAPKLSKDSKVIQDIGQTKKDLDNKVQAQQRARRSSINQVSRRIRVPLFPYQKKVNEVFDNFEEKVYNKNNIINLLEEIINEVSDKFIRDKIKNSEEEIDNNEEIKKQLRTEESKKKVDDIEIPLKHKLEVLKNKFENRIIKRAKAEEDDSKKKEGN